MAIIGMFFQACVIETLLRAAGWLDGLSLG